MQTYGKRKPHTKSGLICITFSMAGKISKRWTAHELGFKTVLLELNRDKGYYYISS